jgi:hypothetical protein
MLAYAHPWCLCSSATARRSIAGLPRDGQRAIQMAVLLISDMEPLQAGDRLSVRHADEPHLAERRWQAIVRDIKRGRYGDPFIGGINGA